MIGIKRKNNAHIFLGIAIAIVLFPLILLAEHAPLPVHDYLDSGFAYLKMFKDNNLWLTLNSATPAVGGMSSAYFLWAQFGFSTFLHFLFPIYWAHIACIVTSMVLAFSGLRLLLNTILPNYYDSLIILGVSFLFCLLPNFYNWSIAVASIPLIVVIFKKITEYKTNELPLPVLCLIFYPFFSSFGMPGIFIVGLWLLGTVFISITKKKIHIPLLTGLILLTTGYIILDIKLFYMRFVLDEALNRSISLKADFNIQEQFFIFYDNFKSLFLKGHYHGPSVHKVIIFPVVMGTFVLSVLNCIGKKCNLKFLNKLFDNYFIKNNSLEKYLYVVLTLLTCVFISALGSTQILDRIFSIILPPLQGLSFARFFLFARFLWYVAFAVAICLWWYEFKREQLLRLLSKPMLKTFFCIFLTMLFILQFMQILRSDPRLYLVLSRPAYTTLWEHLGLTEKLPLQNFEPVSNTITASIHDYYAEKLFQSIKKDITYNNENALSFVLDPVILTYNGIRTPGGYLSVYPLKYMQKFRTLLEPEFAVNHQDRDYYDSWGGRLYLYNRDTAKTGYMLRIDANALRKEFHVKYIFSTVEIHNAKDIGLQFHKKYFENEIPYSVYLYIVQ